jgi:lipopolysaccharide transport system ATP-binding protein
MSSEIVIRAERVSKLFRLGLREQARGDSLAAMMLGALKSPVKNYRKYRALYNFSDVDESSVSPDIIWALRDVSFDVRRGEVLGIVGRNGAGKSTLLKILTRITPPTKGRIEMKGRVSSLLEVGTGFHQELSGRDNIYLNGTILGMTKREVDRKFDEIVEFSGVERFLDTPVKRYSSGMSVRLAFAVAAHLEPEILIVDEVLAVGDATFQKKCIEKMQDVGRHGRTILFVSHNMAAVNRLCSRAILLSHGGLAASGKPHDVIGRYLHDGTGVICSYVWSEDRAPGGEVARLRAARIVNRSGATVDCIDIRGDIGLQMEYDVLQHGHVLLPHFQLHNDEGVLLFQTHDSDPAWRRRPRPPGRYASTAWIPGNFLASGTFYASCGLVTRQGDVSQFWEPQAISFNVNDNMGDDTARGDWGGDIGGVIRPVLEWQTAVERSEQPERYSAV